MARCQLGILTQQLQAPAWAVSVFPLLPPCQWGQSKKELLGFPVDSSDYLIGVLVVRVWRLNSVQHWELDLGSCGGYPLMSGSPH